MKMWVVFKKIYDDIERNKLITKTIYLQTDSREEALEKTVALNREEKNEKVMYEYDKIKTIL